MEFVAAKKQKGSWGENCVDAWFIKQGWKVLFKNKRVWKGEIDRVYCKSPNRICVVEVKTRCFQSKKDLQILQTENGLATIFKKSQLSCMARMAESLHTHKGEIRIRVFVVGIFKIKDGLEAFEANNALREVQICPGFGIYSLIPEFGSSRFHCKLEGLRPS